MSGKTVINNALIKTLKAAEKPYEIRDFKLTGFIIRVYPSGKMSYVCQYGRGKRMNVGKTSELTPTIARELAKDILADVRKGRDPQAEKKKVKLIPLKAIFLMFTLHG